MLIQNEGDVVEKEGYSKSSIEIKMGSARIYFLDLRGEEHNFKKSIFIHY
jgi:hypothetical protein